MGYVQRRGTKYVARYRDPEGAERSKSFDRKVTANAFLADVDVRIARGEWVSPEQSNATVASLYPAWIATKRTLELTSQDSWESLWRSQVEPRWGRKKVRAIRKTDVQVWVNELASRDKPLSASRISQSLMVLSGILSIAIDEHRIAVNPTKGVKKRAPSSGKVRALTTAQTVRLIELMPAHWHDPVRVLVTMGLRISELTGLQVSKVDLTPGNEQIFIDRALVEKAGRGLIEKAPKSHEVRTLPLPAFMVPVLARAVKGKEGYETVFDGPRGAGPIRGSSLRPALRRASVEVKDKDGVVTRPEPFPALGVIRPKDLRSTCASLAIAQGGDVVSVSEFLGHKDAVVTLKKYSAAFQENLTRLVEGTDSLWAGMPGMTGMTDTPVISVFRNSAEDVF